jgi:hypothetical protein
MIADAIGLDLRVYGALTILRDIMFDRGGALPDDGRLICRALGCDPRGWPTMRKALLSSGKVYEAEGMLRSPYVDKTVQAMERYRMKKEIAGHISQAVQHKRRIDVASHQHECKEKPAKPLKNLDLDSTHVQQYQSPESRYKEEKKEAPPSPPLESGAVVAKESGEGGPEGPKTEPRPIVISNLLAHQIKSRWHQ